MAGKEIHAWPQAAVRALWVRPWHGQIWNRPLETTDGLIVASSTGLLKLEQATGALKWKADVGDVVRSALRQQDVLFAGTRLPSPGVVAVRERSGAVAWRFRSEDDSDFEATPVEVEGNPVVLSHDGSLFVLNAGTGDVTCQVEVGESAYAALAQDAGLVVAASLEGNVRAFELRDLELYPRWKQQLSSAVFAEPLITNAVVYVGADGGELVALDRSTGERRWTTALGSIRFRPVIDNGRLFLSAGEKVVCVDAETGATRWEFVSPEAPADVLLQGERLYFGVPRVGLVALNALSGAVEWFLKDVRGRPTSPLILGQRLFYARSLTRGAEVVALELSP